MIAVYQWQCKLWCNILQTSKSYPLTLTYLLRSIVFQLITSSIREAASQCENNLHIDQ